MDHNDKKAVCLYLLKFTLPFSCLLQVQFAGTYNTMWFLNILHNLLICCIIIYATYYVGANMSLSRHPHRPMCYLLCYVGGQHAPKETPPQTNVLLTVLCWRPARPQGDIPTAHTSSGGRSWCLCCPSSSLSRCAGRPSCGGCGPVTPPTTCTLPCKCNNTHLISLSSYIPALIQLCFPLLIISVWKVYSNT